MTFMFAEMHGKKVGWVTYSFSRNRDCCFTMVKHVSLVNGLCLEKKKMWLKPCVARNGDTCLKLRSFSQPQTFFQQFCFHEIRLTDRML